MNPTLTLVKINDIDVGSVLFNWDQNPVLGDKVKSVSINLHRNVYNLIPELETSPTGLTVTVQRGATSPTEEFIFRGSIVQRDTVGSSVVIKCNDKLYQAIQKNITKTFNKNIDTEAGKISDIFITLANSANLNTSSSVMDSGTVILLDTFICNNADVFERMQRLAELLDWQFYYNSSDDLLHFEPKGTRAGTSTLEVGVNVQNRPQWIADGTKIVKIARLFGGPVQTQTTNSFTASAAQTDFNLSEIPTNVRITVDGVEKLGGLEGQELTADYFVDQVNKLVTFSTPLSGGEAVVIELQFLSPLTIEASNPVETGLEIRIDKEDITKVSDGENYINTYIGRRSTEFLKTVFDVVDTQDIEVGQTVNAIDSNEGINDTFIVTRIRKRYPYAFDQIEIDNEPLQIEEWDVSIEDRLKRIEERLAQEETLVIFLRSGDRTIKMGREFVKMETQAINDSFVLGHITNSILGSGGVGLGERNSSPVVQQLFQGGDVYLEDFLNDDFQGGTASWSNTGLVTFTSGQIAQSSTVDFNNGTITQCTLTSTEVSGSFDYELTADGTNWETVTSGLLHTFTNTGTDLRWRATENVASTGEISKIKLGEYKD